MRGRLRPTRGVLGDLEARSDIAPLQLFVLYFFIKIVTKFILDWDSGELAYL